MNGETKPQQFLKITSSTSDILDSQFYCLQEFAPVPSLYINAAAVEYFGHLFESSNTVEIPLPQLRSIIAVIIQDAKQLYPELNGKSSSARELAKFKFFNLRRLYQWLRALEARTELLQILTDSDACFSLEIATYENLKNL